MISQQQSEARAREEAVRSRVVAEQTRLFNKPSEEVTLNDIDRMTSDEYKRRLQKDPAFATRIDELEAANIAAHPRPV